MFDEKDVTAIAKDAMKSIFAQKQIAQKHAERKAKHNRKESVKPPNLFGRGDFDEDSDDELVAKKRAERAAKHNRKESVKPPNLFGRGYLDSDEDALSDLDDGREQRMKRQIKS